MNFKALAARRKIAGLSGTLILCLVLALTIDGMIAGGRKDPNLFDITPGQTLMLSDLMPRGAETLDALSLRSSSPDISVKLTETFSGFWMGGTLWRAEATVPGATPQGEYTIDMYYQNGTQAAPPQTFRFRIHKDAASVQAAALSLGTKLFGFSPYFMAVCLLPLALLPMGLSLLLSRRIGLALREEGMSEIYRSMASPEGQRIFFALIPGRPLAENDAIQVLDERGEKLLGTALVFAIKKGDAEAIMQDEAHVRPGTLAKMA